MKIVSRVVGFAFLAVAAFFAYFWFTELSDENQFRVTVKCGLGIIIGLLWDIGRRLR
ncbi:hypothetical protein [Dyella sp.]|uniref:hypothetical protein n=1 Tax=Dyella sp. TaxID=1869338 RepID=UPI002FDB0CEC